MSLTFKLIFIDKGISSEKCVKYSSSEEIWELLETEEEEEISPIPTSELTLDISVAFKLLL